MKIFLTLERTRNKGIFQELYYGLQFSSIALVQNCNSKSRASATYISELSIARLLICLWKLGAVWRFFSASVQDKNRSVLSAKAMSIPFLY